MISVMHVIDTGGPGGAETVFAQVATGLDPRRFRSTPIVPSRAWLAATLEARGAIPVIAPAQGSFNLAYLLKLRSLAQRTQTDVIIAHLYGSAVYASLLGRLGSIPVIAVLHGQTDIAVADRFAVWKAAIVRRGSREVVFVSDELRRELAPRLGLRANRCTVIPNGVDTDRFFPAPDRSLRTELAMPDDAMLIGAIGNVRTPKAYDVLLRAARLLVDRIPRVHLVIAGDADNALGRELGALRDALGLRSQVTFLGLRADIAQILRNLDVFVLSSRTEGFSIACVEAMACGIPVVATRSGGPEEILRDDAGLLVPTGDPGALAAAIERLIESPDLAQRLASTALARVCAHYSLATMLDRYERLVTSLADESGGPHR